MTSQAPSVNFLNNQGVANLKTRASSGGEVHQKAAPGKLNAIGPRIFPAPMPHEACTCTLSSITASRDFRIRLPSVRTGATNRPRHPVKSTAPMAYSANSCAITCIRVSHYAYDNSKDIAVRSSLVSMPLCMLMFEISPRVIHIRWGALMSSSAPCHLAIVYWVIFL